MFDLDAAIIPGRSAAGISIGTAADEILSREQPLRRQPLKTQELLTFDSVELWVEDGRVRQIALSAGYRGTLAGSVGIGTTLGDVISLLGPVEEDEEDNLIVPGLPGWCFDTTHWTGGGEARENLTARVEVVIVFA